MVTPQNVEMERTGSHHVSDEHARGGYREQVYGHFKATWRGEPVMVTMQADRYTHSSGLSDWRIYAEDARSFDPERNGGRGEPVTDTARARLSEACKPVMAAWLESDKYPASLANAVRNMIVREMDGKYGKYGNGAGTMFTRYGHHLTPAQRTAIQDALDQRDAYLSAQATAANA